MNHYTATTNSSAIAVDSSICIRSGVLKTGDMLDIRYGEAPPIAARIESMGLSGLVIHQGGRTLSCRPWRLGDACIDRFGGAISCWTVEQVADAALADAG